MDGGIEKQQKRDVAPKQDGSDRAPRLSEFFTAPKELVEKGPASALSRMGSLIRLTRLPPICRASR
jgi:hypothetical protein